MSLHEIHWTVCVRVFPRVRHERKLTDHRVPGSSRVGSLMCQRRPSLPRAESRISSQHATVAGETQPDDHASNQVPSKCHLIAECEAGRRNHKVSKAYVEAEGSMTMEELETEMLKGQKLQGTLTCKEIYAILQREDKIQEYPLFVVIYRIVFGDIPLAHSHPRLPTRLH
jgi:hypothetical protein